MTSTAFPSLIGNVKSVEELRAIDETLIRAVEAGNRELARDLLSRGAHGHAVDGDGRTALMVAAASGFSLFIPALLPVSNPMASASRERDTALHLAAAAGHASCARLLLPASNPLAVNALGRTPLMLAARHARLECVRLLLPVSDPAARDTADGLAALHHATQGLGDAAALCCELLAEAAGVDLRAGLDLSPANPGATALLLAVEHARSISSANTHALADALRAVRSLILAGADVHARCDASQGLSILELVHRREPDSISRDFSEALAERERRVLDATLASARPSEPPGGNDAAVLSSEAGDGAFARNGLAGRKTAPRV
jgi:ankyrin repeat protein